MQGYVVYIPERRVAASRPICVLAGAQHPSSSGLCRRNQGFYVSIPRPLGLLLRLSKYPISRPGTCVCKLLFGFPLSKALGEFQRGWVEPELSQCSLFPPRCSSPRPRLAATSHCSPSSGTRRFWFDGREGIPRCLLTSDACFFLLILHFFVTTGYDPHPPGFTESYFLPLGKRPHPFLTLEPLYLPIPGSPEVNTCPLCLPSCFCSTSVHPNVLHPETYHSGRSWPC